MGTRPKSFVTRLWSRMNYTFSSVTGLIYYTGWQIIQPLCASVSWSAQRWQFCQPPLNMLPAISLQEGSFQHEAEPSPPLASGTLRVTQGQLGGIITKRHCRPLSLTYFRPAIIGKMGSWVWYNKRTDEISLSSSRDLPFLLHPGAGKSPTVTLTETRLNSSPHCSP